MLYIRKVQKHHATEQPVHVLPLFSISISRIHLEDIDCTSKAKIIQAYYSTCLNDVLNIDSPYFKGMVNRIYPPESQLNKGNTSDTVVNIYLFHTDLIHSKIFYVR